MKKKFLVFLLIAVLLAAGYKHRDKVAEFLGIGATTAYPESRSHSEMNRQTTREPAVEITDVGSPYKTYYHDLTEEEKHLYNEVLSGIYDIPQDFTVEKVTNDQVERAFSALLYDNPDLFFVGRTNQLITYESEFKFLKQNSKATVSFEYAVTKSEYVYMKEKLDAVCDEIISGIPSDDVWEIEKYFHDYIIDNCTYHYEENDYIGNSAYGALVDGKSACEGYAKAMKLLLDKAGIKSAVVCGMSSQNGEEPGRHMWNAVEIGGKWYYLDVTWDDPVDEEGGERREYTYFNVDADFISSTHTELYKEFDCTSMEENFFVKSGMYFDYYDNSVCEKIAAKLAENLENGDDSVRFKFADKEAYEAAVHDIDTNKKFSLILTLAKKNTDVSFYIDRVNWSPDEEHYTIKLTPERVG